MGPGFESQRDHVKHKGSECFTVFCCLYPSPTGIFLLTVKRRSLSFFTFVASLVARKCFILKIFFMSLSVKALLKSQQQGGTQFIYIRLLISRRAKYYNTGYRVEKSFWNQNLGMVTADHPIARYLNRQIIKKKSKSLILLW
jgi:hypothetical protein